MAAPESCARIETPILTAGRLSDVTYTVSRDLVSSVGVGLVAERRHGNAVHVDAVRPLGVSPSWVRRSVRMRRLGELRSIDQERYGTRRVTSPLRRTMKP